MHATLLPAPFFRSRLISARIPPSFALCFFLSKAALLLPFPSNAQSTSRPAPPSPLPPVGTLCTTRIETQIYAPLPSAPSPSPAPPAPSPSPAPSAPSKHALPSAPSKHAASTTPHLHIRAAYQMAVVSSDATGYIVEGQTIEYTPLLVMGRPANNTLKGLLAVYIGAMWRVHLDPHNTIRTIHYGQPAEHTNKHKKATERAIQLIFLRWPAPPHRPLRRWRYQHTSRQNGSFPCTQVHSLQYKLHRLKQNHLSLQSTLRQNTRCSDTKRTIQSQSSYQGTVHLTYRGLPQRTHWRGFQSDTSTTLTHPTQPQHHARPARIDVHTTCAPPL
ncbi:hypothetical protein L6R29_14710 [Myxococcota bacterium]|nr:hypothetical protein [Myxococcota bacterium]